MCVYITIYIWIMESSRGAAVSSPDSCAGLHCTMTDAVFLVSKIALYY